VHCLSIEDSSCYLTIYTHIHRACVRQLLATRMAEPLSDRETSTGTCNNNNCSDHYHAQDPIFTNGETRQRPPARPMEQPSTISEGQASDPTLVPEKGTFQSEKEGGSEPEYNPDDHGFRRIIRNFTPSYVCRCNHTSREHKYDQYAD
jgi:hypothetical protein